MNCKHCGKPIVLVPSAHERAKKFGGTPASYTRLFEYHAECALIKRQAETLAFVRSLNGTR